MPQFESSWPCRVISDGFCLTSQASPGSGCALTRAKSGTALGFHFRPYCEDDSEHGKPHDPGLIAPVRARKYATYKRVADKRKKDKRGQNPATPVAPPERVPVDRKSTRLNSS